MEVSRAVLEQVFNEITTSVGYTTTVGPIDKGKVSRRRSGQPTPLPSSKLGRAAWRVAALLEPLAPPPPPPPPYLKVAPRAAEKQDASDARFCLFNQPGGALRPGCFQITSGPNSGKYSDESGAIYTNADGLDESGIRSDAPALTKAKEIDGREICSLPLFGDPLKNTGSWSV